MTETNPPISPPHPALSWAAAILPALAMAYGAGMWVSIISGVVVQVFNPFLWLAVIVVVAVAGTLMLRRIPNLWRRAGVGLQRAGWILLGTFPLLVVIAVVMAQSDSSSDQGGAAAAFFLVLIFGLNYLFQGLILLVIGTLLKRRGVA